MSSTDSASSESNVILERRVHWLMAMVGGVLGGYAVYLRGGNFGSAQTGNMMEMAAHLVDGEFMDVLIRLGAFVLYAATLIIATLVPKYTNTDFRKGCIVLEAFGLVLCCFIPVNMNNVIALYPVFIISAMQWSVYCGVGKYRCATIFSTNNIRQASTALAEYIYTKKPEHKDKAKFYGYTIINFSIGIFLGVLGVKYFMTFGILIGLIPLAAAFLLSQKLIREVEDIDKITN